jgi:hypothetical protein
MRLTDIVTVETEGAHGGFEMVHSKTLVPTPRPEMLVVGESELVIVPDPDRRAQEPVPTEGVFAAMTAFGLLMHKVWLGPAFETEGLLFTVIVTLEEEAGHAPLEMTHTKTLFPTGKPVTEVFGDKEFVMVPEPETSDQLPLPITGIFPDRVVVGLVMHKV